MTFENIGPATNGLAMEELARFAGETWARVRALDLDGYEWLDAEEGARADVLLLCPSSRADHIADVLKTTSATWAVAAGAVHFSDRGYTGASHWSLWNLDDKAFDWRLEIDEATPGSLRVRQHSRGTMRPRQMVATVTMWVSLISGLAALPLDTVTAIQLLGDHDRACTFEYAGELTPVTTAILRDTLSHLPEGCVVEIRGKVGEDRTGLSAKVPVGHHEHSPDTRRDDPTAEDPRRRRSE
jgi:hypothetical protein